MAKAKLGGGDISITLNNREYALRPTLNAAMVLSRRANGIRGVIDQVIQMNMDTIIQVVTVGLGPQQARDFKDIGSVIWEAGLTDDTGGVIAKCIEYLHVLANGGRAINKEADADASENPPQEE